MSLNKAELINRVAARSGDHRIVVAAILDLLIDEMAAALKGGETVRLTGLGIFSVVETAQRTARNPKTGETVVVPAGRRVKMKPSSPFSVAAGC